MDALSGRARDEYLAACGDATSGNACASSVCDRDVTLDTGIPGADRNLSVDGVVFNIHDTAQPVDVAAAELLNTLCSFAPGDPFAAAQGSLGTQMLQLQSFARHSAFGLRPGEVAPGAAPGAPGAAPVVVTAVPVSVLSVGGAFEKGTDTTGFHLPFAYARNLSATQFLNVAGGLSYASREEMTQIGVSLTPAYGYLKRDGTTRFGFGAYVPLSFATTSISTIDDGYTSFAFGGGAIGTLSLKFSETTLSGGLATAARPTDTAFTVPTTSLVHVQHPVSLLVDLFAMASYGLDPASSGTGYFIGGAGAAIGKWEVGYRGFFGSDYVAHVIGVETRIELEGSFALEQPSGPAAAEEKQE